MRKITVLFTTLLLLLSVSLCSATTLIPFRKTDGISLQATRNQNANITALQTLVTKNDSTTATAAELNYLDITTLGTGAASKAVVLDAGDDYTWPATGVLTYGVLKDPAATTITATGAELNYLDITTLGTGAASKAVVLDAGDDYTWPATGILTYGVLKDPAGTTLGATVAEINRAADVSARKVSLTGTAAITEVLHEGKINVITGTGAAYTYTLPEATGSGAVYRFYMGQVNTSNTIFVTADLTNCSFFGSVNILDLDAAAQGAYAPAATDGTMTLNGTTTGGAIGDYIEFTDIATDQWGVRGQLQVPTGSNPATPFGA